MIAIGVVIAVVWALGLLFFLALFRAGAKADELRNAAELRHAAEVRNADELHGRAEDVAKLSRSTA